MLINHIIILGFQHFTVNHKYNFVDPTTKVHTQNIERLWGSVKWRNKKERGTKRAFIEIYLAEFICRKCLMNDSPFDWTLQQIALQFPPDINAGMDEKNEMEENEEFDMVDDQENEIVIAEELEEEFAMEEFEMEENKVFDMMDDQEM